MSKLQLTTIPPCLFLSSQYLLQVSGPKFTQIGQESSFFRKLLSYRDDGPLPMYVELGRACLNEDPEQRPTFEEAYEALRAILATFRAHNEAQYDGLDANAGSDPRLQAEDWIRKCQKETLEKMRCVAASIQGASGERLLISECIVCLDTYGSTFFKGKWGDYGDVAVRDVLLVDGIWENDDRRLELEKVLGGQSVPDHPNLVRCRARCSHFK